MPLLPNKKGNIIDAWNYVMTSASPVRHVTIEEIMAVADKAIIVENAWRRYMKDRYGV